MQVWIVLVHLWLGGTAQTSGTYETEAACMDARMTMDIRSGAAVCAPALAQGA